MGRRPPTRQPPLSAPWLRRMDQLAVAVLVGAALVAMAGYWLLKGGHRGRLIEIDRAHPLRVQYTVDLNEATWPELAQLPGIGEILARRIVDSRAADGPFFDHGDLERVEGIGPLTMERISPYLLPLPGSGMAAKSTGESRRVP